MTVFHSPGVEIRHATIADSITSVGRGEIRTAVPERSRTTEAIASGTGATDVERQRVSVLKGLSAEGTLDGDDSSVAVGGHATLERQGRHLPPSRAGQSWSISSISSPQNSQMSCSRASRLTELTSKIAVYFGDSVWIAPHAGGFDILRGFVTPVAQ